MKKFSSVVQSALSSGIYSGFLLVEILLPSIGVVKRYATLPYDITMDGLVFSADDRLLSVDPPKQSDAVDRAAYKVVFLDNDMEFAQLGKHLLNGKVRVLGGLYNTSGADMMSSTGVLTKDEQIFTNLTDTITLYEGYIDTAQDNMQAESGVTFAIECASPMAGLDVCNSFYTSTTSLRQRVPSEEWAAAPDTAFDRVSLGGKSVEVLWGKI